MCAIGGGSVHLFGFISLCLFSIGCLLLFSSLVTNSQVKATMWQFITVSNILNWKMETRLISWAQGAQRSTETDTRHYYYFGCCVSHAISFAVCPSSGHNMLAAADQTMGMQKRNKISMANSFRTNFLIICSNSGIFRVWSGCCYKNLCTVCGLLILKCACKMVIGQFLCSWIRMWNDISGVTYSNLIVGAWFWSPHKI